MFKYDQEWLEKLDETIEQNIGDAEYQLPNLANDMAISTAQLNRKINKLVGLSPRMYIRSKKLTKAKELLEIGAYPTVAEISAAVGYKQPIHFSTVFYQKYGKRPVEYLRNEF